ncbi:hypothetical protein ACONRW_004669 [Vibrio parahaemolyticus]|nr:hypothetical protein [Vibrio parahaemolyticus]
MSDPSILSIIAPGVFALLGVYFGSKLKSKSDKETQLRELKIKSFTKVVSLKLPLTQVIQTNAEAQLLCQYYDARFHLTGNQVDQDEAKAQNARMLSLIPEVAATRSEFAAALAELKIAFAIDKNLNKELMEIYKAQSLYVPEVNGKFSSVSKLDEWKDNNAKQIVEILKKQYSDKIEAVIEKLYSEFEKL